MKHELSTKPKSSCRELEGRRAAAAGRIDKREVALSEAGEELIAGLESRGVGGSRGARSSEAATSAGDSGLRKEALPPGRNG